jgi:hypothetical protein
MDAEIIAHGTKTHHGVTETRSEYVFGCHPEAIFGRRIPLTPTEFVPLEASQSGFALKRMKRSI